MCSWPATKPVTMATNIKIQDTRTEDINLEEVKIKLLQ
jgi:hypothetical protein